LGPTFFFDHEWILCLGFQSRWQKNYQLT
jgi:hypothetical protein